MSRCGPLVLTAIALLLARPLSAQKNPIGYFAELGGGGGFASLNLDVAVAPRIQARIGAGTILWPTIPITATYLIGSRNRALEVGGGVTVAFFPEEDPNDPFPRQIADFLTVGKGVGTVGLLTGVLGYRHETASGSTFRASFTPMFGHGKVVPWFGLSLGGRF